MSAHTCFIGEPNEFGQRQEVMGLCALMALQYQIYNAFDVKLTKQVWELHKKVGIYSVHRLQQDDFQGGGGISPP